MSKQNTVLIEQTARAWHEKVIIPTYGVGTPEKNPMFLEKRVYQGSSGVVYPYPVIEKISDVKTNKEWNAVFLENRYLKIMILPELGGRIQMAYDKVKQRHFVYYNQVIKPALVGLTGPWISGGIEFNWPQHHRPSTFEPVDHLIEENADGSVTVWCSEIERMFRTKGMAGFTLHPDKAYLEIRVKLYNRTDFPQTFLWWANPAVKVNDAYQSVFPPDVHAVFDHGKRAVSEFPIAKGTYYKVDYSPGTDISKYKNIPVPTSYMAITSKYDFVGGFENDSKGGLLHIANHHISPGKKQWTWGNGDFGKAWDKCLTDEDGPYIELMCGVYTDNQPDFSWIMPGEEKSFTQYFMPYRDLGIVKNATKNALINLEITDNSITVKVYTTAEYPESKINLFHKSTSILSEAFDFHPGLSYGKSIPVPSDFDEREIFVEVRSAGGMLLVDWKPDEKSSKEIPEPAKEIMQPSDISDNESLYIAGLHLEQYRHATYSALEYYKEALLRNPNDIRCNNALGLWYLRRGQFNLAENHFRTAIGKLTEFNPNPIDGEPYLNLGMALLLQEKDEEAYDAFYKSTWNAACVDNGFFQIARLEAKTNSWTKALESIERSLSRNQFHQKARHLKSSILRKKDENERALDFIEESLSLDRFNSLMYFEQYLINKKVGSLNQLRSIMRANIHSYIEFALDYAFAGMYDEALAFISLGISEHPQESVNPIALYCKSWFESKLHTDDTYLKTLHQASLACPDYCFPNQAEVYGILRWAIRCNPADARAYYYAGNFLYNARIYEEAMKLWERAAELHVEFPTVHRNLSLAYYNQKNDPLMALVKLEFAFSLDETDSRVLMELDQLYKKLNYDPNKRLNLLDKNIKLVEERDDLFLERISLLNHFGQYETAHKLIMKRNFHPWEGGEGKVIAQYVYSLTEMAKKAIASKQYQAAVEKLQKAMVCPENLGEERIFGTLNNELNYFLGVAYEGLSEQIKAKEFWKKASDGMCEPAFVMFYNDQQPDSIFYQGQSLAKLGETFRADDKFNKLIEFGKSHLSDHVAIDYFAVSLPDLLIWNEDLTQRNEQLCLYLTGLGEMGKGNLGEAKKLFNKVLTFNCYHEGAIRHLNDLETSKFIQEKYDIRQDAPHQD